MGSVNQTWYILFSPNHVKPHWVHQFLNKKFLHCYCFRTCTRSKPTAVYVADPRTSHISAEVLHRTNAYSLATLLSVLPNTTILKFTSPLDFENKLFTIWNMAPTCVTVVKMFLGITAKAQTPYQLYKHLLKLGATQI